MSDDGWGDLFIYVNSMNGKITEKEKNQILFFFYLEEMTRATWKGDMDFL